MNIQRDFCYEFRAILSTIAAHGAYDIVQFMETTAICQGLLFADDGIEIGISDD
jgi:hypothetical protein